MTGSEMGTPDGLPFFAAKLDALMEEAGLDVLLVTSKHNIQYLTGGHRHPFFDYADAIGVSRYLPVLVYEKGRPDHAAYIANRNEGDAIAVRRREHGFWLPTVVTGASGTVEAMRLALDHVGRIGADNRRIGVEKAFLPADAAELLTGFRVAEALRPLELLRACKTERELRLLREASDLVVDAMLAVIAGHGPGSTKRQLAEALRRAETDRGLIFEYCLITAGTGLQRSPSDEVWGAGDILSLDSGGNHHGYIGDLCRMAILGEADAELEDLLGEVDAIQQAARGVIRAGLSGGDVYAPAEARLKASPHAKDLRFVAHGMGLVSHEAPRLTATGPVPYPASDADRPLEVGMVLSIETTLLHPRRGFIKLEDTVAVTAAGSEGFGDRGRGWNRGATAL